MMLALLTGIIQTGTAALPPIRVASESMLPNYAPGVLVRPEPFPDGGPAHGQVVLLRHRSGEVRLARVVALAGDKVALVGGVIHLNGQADSLSLEGPGPQTSAGPSTRYRAQQAGASYAILDLGRTAGDDMSEIIVPEGHAFLLGDNRDNANDSRFPPDQGGLGMVPFSRLIGIAVVTSLGRQNEGPPSK